MLLYLLSFSDFFIDQQSQSSDNDTLQNPNSVAVLPASSSHYYSACKDESDNQLLSVIHQDSGEETCVFSDPEVDQYYDDNPSHSSNKHPTHYHATQLKLISTQQETLTTSHPMTTSAELCIDIE